MKALGFWSVARATPVMPMAPAPAAVQPAVAGGLVADAQPHLADHGDVGLVGPDVEVLLGLDKADHAIGHGVLPHVDVVAVDAEQGVDVEAPLATDAVHAELQPSWRPARLFSVVDQ